MLPAAAKEPAAPPGKGDDQVDGLCAEWVAAIAAFRAAHPTADVPELLARHRQAAPSLYAAFDNFLREVEAGVVLRDAEAEERKAKGNAAFKQGQHGEATVAYTHALAAARSDGACAVLLANRANAHFQLQAWPLALLDAQAAVELNPGYAKAYFRRGHALRQLGFLAEAQQDLDWSAALEGKLEAAPAGQPQDNDRPAAPLAMSQRVCDLVADLRRRMQLGPAAEEVESQPLIQVHPDVQLYQDDRQGRGCRAARRLERGTVLVSEWPLAHVLRPEHLYTHCAWGLASCPTLAPSAPRRAAGVKGRGLFSTAAAAEQDWATWGAVEAAHPFFLVCPLDFLLAARLYLLRARPPLAASLPSSALALLGIAPSAAQLGNDHLCSLRGYSREADPDLVCGGSESACVALALHCGAVRTLVLHADLKASDDPGDGVVLSEGLLRSCCQALVRLMRAVLTNGVAVTKLTSAFEKGGATATVKQQRIGKAVYAFSSLFNHSCDPNCHLQWAGGPYESTPRLVVRTSVAVAAGEPLTLSYGPHKNRLHSAAHRRRLLREQYNFHCECPACARPDSALPATDEVQDVWQKAADLYQKGKRLAGTRRFPDALDALRGSLDLLTRCLPAGYQPKHVLAKTYDAIAEVYGLQDDFPNSAEWCEKGVQLLQEVYGPESLEIAAEYDKLAGVLFRAGQYPRALAYIDRAVPLLRCFYGERHEGVAELGQYRALILEKCPPQANPELSGTGNGQPPLEVDWLSKRISHNLGMYTKRKTRKTGHQKSPAVGGGSASPAGLADEWREPSQDVRLSWGAGRLAHRREGVGRPPWERPPGAPAIDLR
eukprot:EG_transcript_3335